MKRLTKAQQVVLDAFRRLDVEVAPSISELAVECQLSRGTVHHHIIGIRRCGYDLVTRGSQQRPTLSHEVASLARDIDLIYRAGRPELTTALLGDLNSVLDKARGLL